MYDQVQLRQEIKRRRTEEHDALYSQAYSEDGHLLAVGSSAGSVCVWDVERVLSQKATPEERSQPINSFQAHDGSVYTMVTYNEYLITAGGPDINVWRWQDLSSSKNITPVYTLQTHSDSSSHYEVNSLSIDHKAGLLFAGSGDCNVYVFDLQQQKLVQTLQGHTQYVHCVTALPRSSRCASASEDGSVRLWDVRTNQKPTELWPHKAMGTPHAGFMSTVAVDGGEDWLACGGSCAGSLWSLVSNTFVTALKSTTPTSTVASMVFTETGLTTVGNSSVVQDWTHEGDLIRQVKCSSPELFSIAQSTSERSPLQIKSIAGTSNTIDLIMGDGQRMSFGLTFDTKLPTYSADPQTNSDDMEVVSR
eukprot:m.96282 g.96282  ORF g.96282 m.96282 type:complete len:363 (-) comp26882_c1_seq1:22-1110(-)